MAILEWAEMVTAQLRKITTNGGSAGEVSSGTTPLLGVTVQRKGSAQVLPGEELPVAGL